MGTVWTCIDALRSLSYIVIVCPCKISLKIFKAPRLMLPLHESDESPVFASHPAGGPDLINPKRLPARPNQCQLGRFASIVEIRFWMLTAAAQGLCPGRAHGKHAGCAVLAAPDRPGTRKLPSAWYASGQRAKRGQTLCK